MKIDVEGDLPSPSGRGREARARQGEASRNGEGLSICIDLRPSPAAPRRPLPEGEVMPRMHAPRATFCEKSPSVKFCPASVRQQPLQPATTSLMRMLIEIHEKFRLLPRF